MAPVLKQTKFIAALCTATFCIVVMGFTVRAMFAADPGPVLIKPSAPFHAVWVNQTEGAGQVSLALVYPTGERTNPFEEGLAHYLEHLAWHNIRKSTENLGRHSNAWTNRFSTGYKMNVPSEKVGDAIVDLMQTANPLTISPQDAAQEAQIVLREFDLWDRENPQAEIWQEMTQSLYAGSGYARSVIGRDDDIARFSKARAAQLHEASHNLAEATLFVSGPVDLKQMKATLGALPAVAYHDDSQGQPASRLRFDALSDVQAITSPGIGEDKVILRTAGPRPTQYGPADLEARIIATNALLNSTRQSGLAKSLRFDAFVARRFVVELFASGPDVLEFYFEAVPDAGVTLQSLLDASDTAIEAALSAALQSDFEIIRARAIDDFEAVLDVGAANEDRLRGALINNTPFAPFDDVKRALQRLTFKDLTEFHQLIRQHPRRVVRLVASSETAISGK